MKTKEEIIMDGRKNFYIWEDNPYQQHTKEWCWFEDGYDIEMNLWDKYERESISSS